MKNKTIVLILVMLAGTFLSGYFGPWWAPAGFIVLSSALMGLSSKQAIGIGSGTLGVIFLVMAVFLSTKDESGLLQKTGSLMGGLSSGMLVALTMLFGGLTGFFSGWLGSALGVILRNTKK
jgi:MFS family permease